MGTAEGIARHDDVGGFDQQIAVVRRLAPALLDVGAADDDMEEVDVDDDVVDDGLGDLLFPHPVTATPTTTVAAAKPVAVADTFITIDPFGVWSRLLCPAQRSGPLA